MTKPRVLDLGTGTGAIALAIAKELPQAQVIAVDASPEAVKLAQQNCLHLRLANVTLFQSDWFTQVEGKFHLILSNPPYIEDQDEHLHSGDVRFEPRSALVAARGGLSDIEWIIKRAPEFLLAGGYLYLEHGWRQGQAVRTLLSAANFHQVETCQDYNGNDRISGGLFAEARAL